MPALNIRVFHGIAFNIKKRILTKGKQHCVLSPSQVGILRLLINSQKPLNKEYLSRKVTNCSTGASVQALICGIRNKLRDIGLDEEIILTANGSGYFIKDEVKN
jgi:DNA-binding response OmpR family regulator